jgi:HSP20 family molecular chaperone IbpA
MARRSAPSRASSRSPQGRRCATGRRAAGTYRVRVPGYRRKDLDVEVRDRQLVVRGERVRGLLRPNVKRSFAYSMTLPETLDERNVSAELRRGVLCITVGKQPYARARRGRELVVDAITPIGILDRAVSRREMCLVDR